VRREGGGITDRERLRKVNSMPLLWVAGSTMSMGKLLLLLSMTGMCSLVEVEGDRKGVLRKRERNRESHWGMKLAEGEWPDEQSGQRMDGC